MEKIRTGSFYSKLLGHARASRRRAQSALLVPLVIATLAVSLLSSPGPAAAAPPGSAVIAGARVNAAGTVLYWFNYYGGKPTVNHSPGSGVYYVKFPNAPVLGDSTGGNSVLSVTPDTPSADCTMANADYAGSGAATVIAVETKDCTNTFADRGFHLVVFGPPAAPPTPISPAAVAGASYSPSGTLVSSWNDFGGAPTLNHSPGSGIYYVKFPGVALLGSNAAGPVPDSVLSVTPFGPQGFCIAVNADYLGAGPTAAIAVETKDCGTNTFLDSGFYVVVFGPAIVATSSSAPTAIAGARVNASGTVLSWWNDYGGAPTVNHAYLSTYPGVYLVEFPGQSAPSVYSVTPDTPSADCTAVDAFYESTTGIDVETDGCTSGPPDTTTRGFHLVVYGPPPTTTPPTPPGPPRGSPKLTQYPAGVGPTAGNGAQPQELAVGPDGDLWYTDEASGVFKFSPKTLAPLACSSASPVIGCEVSANAVSPNDIVAGPDGAMWFTQSAGGNPRGGQSYFPASIGRLSTTGTYSSYPVPASARSVPGLDAIALGPNGNLWFTETALGRIGEITPKVAGPVTHEFALPAADRLAEGVGSPVTSADTIAAGPGGDIWFTEQGSDAIGVMATSGVLLHKFTVPDPSSKPAPLGITEGPDQSMWFTENAANQVASISAQGKVTLYALPTAADGPESIVYGPDGNLWFTEDTGVASIDPATGKVTAYRAHAALLAPAGLTVGPNCTSVWFTEPSADRLGRVSPVPNATGCKAGAVPVP